ncbi:MAG TPA: cupin domain-containing protein, partial [Desulfobacteraceae bacterium]|nr:cupin domain-containing protein [Desulfobacteraceae bacterium]
MRLILRLILMFCLLTLPAAPAFAGQKTPAKATAKVLAKSGRSWNGTALPAYPLGTPEVSILRI